MSYPCERCASGGRRQTCEHLQAVRGAWDVERAWLLVESAPREPATLTEAELAAVLDGAGLDPDHVGHVEPERPGLLAEVRWCDFAGEWHGAEVLIDGHHRAERCRREGVPFRIYRLNYREARVCQTRPVLPVAVRRI